MPSLLSMVANNPISDFLSFGINPRGSSSSKINLIVLLIANNLLVANLPSAFSPLNRSYCLRAVHRQKKKKLLVYYF